MPKTVILSDCHFGYGGFNRPEFEGFLNLLQVEGDVSHLVLLGDVFDLWRADPVNAISSEYDYFERLRGLCHDVHYVVGNHDYHNRVLWSVRKQKDFLGMTTHYPYWISDEGIFLVHGDYFDIYGIRIAEKAIYAVYESIYHMVKSLVATLEDYFWNPVVLLKKWLELYRESPTKARGEPPAGYLATMINLNSPVEIDELERGLNYLTENPSLAVQMFVPSSMRSNLGNELPSLLSEAEMRGIDTAPVRSIMSEKSPLELAREITGDKQIEKVIYGHTHKAENKSSKGYWNTGSWVDGESTFCEVEDGRVTVFRFKEGRKNPIPETR